jgi:hypothetical protein
MIVWSMNSFPPSTSITLHIHSPCFHQSIMRSFQTEGETINRKHNKRQRALEYQAVDAAAGTGVHVKERGRGKPTSGKRRTSTTEWSCSAHPTDAAATSMGCFCCKGTTRVASTRQEQWRIQPDRQFQAVKNGRHNCVQKRKDKVHRQQAKYDKKSCNSWRTPRDGS